MSLFSCLFQIIFFYVLKYYLNCIYLVDKIKETYKELHKTHKIHKVDENNRIVLREVDVSDFAVKLKIGHCCRPKCNFRDEAKRHLENLKEVTGDVIDISNLIDNKHRVTFIRGIAGMGKSVLAKQLTYGWANGDIYQNFKMCVMFECRDLNYFKDHEGAKLEKHEILGEFIKSKVDYDLGDGEGVLFIIDGLDELFDITEKGSIIGQLLRRKIYYKSKVILTGRPHIEDKVTNHDTMGGLFIVEINGLSEDQIDEYVDKFSSREDHKVDKSNVRTSSKGCLPIMHVPQFLNTFCCVAILMNGQTVLNSTELYCWTVYLLLKQHADKKEGQDQRTISQIFTKYSKTLASLSELCYDLLKENKIIFEGDIESELGKTDEEKAFIRSLFVNVGNNFGEKYQFKHISLMEFLSALYICKKGRKNLKKIIKYNLKKGCIEGVSFVCRLLSGFSYGGIIKEMLKNVVGLEQEANEKQLLRDVIKILDKCGLDHETKLRRSFEIITCFLHENFKEKKFVKSVIRKYHGDDFRSDEVTTDNICEICRHLESCGWKEDDIRMAFANVQFKLIRVSTFEHLDAVTVKKRFRIGSEDIWLRGMKTSVNAICRKFGGREGNRYRGRVDIVGCEFSDDITEDDSNCWQLKGLGIGYCQLKTVESLINVCDWGMSCRVFGLWGLGINNEWWERMVEMIEKRHGKGELKTKRLIIEDCTTRMSHEMAMKVRCFAG